MAKNMPPWYHGDITAELATKILTKTRQPGAFLLRNSQNKKGTYTLSVLRFVEETHNYVDVKHYRITKKEIVSNSQALQKHIQETEAKSEHIPNLMIPIEKSMIEEWEEEDSNWRDRFKVDDAEKDEQKMASTKSKDSKKNSKTFSILRSFRKKKEEKKRKITDQTDPGIQRQEQDEGFTGMNNKEKTIAKASVSSQGHYENAPAVRDNIHMNTKQSECSLSQQSDGIYEDMGENLKKPLTDTIGLSYERGVDSAKSFKNERNNSKEMKGEEESSRCNDDDQLTNADWGIYVTREMTTATHSDVCTGNNELGGTSNAKHQDKHFVPSSQENKDTGDGNVSEQRELGNSADISQKPPTSKDAEVSNTNEHGNDSNGNKQREADNTTKEQANSTNYRVTDSIQIKTTKSSS